MANAGTDLMNSSDNLVATVEQTHFLSVAFNTHMATGPVVRWKAFRKGGLKRKDDRLEGEQAPWHPVSFYDRKARHVTTVVKKSR